MTVGEYWLRMSILLQTSARSPCRSARRSFISCLRPTPNSDTSLKTGARPSATHTRNMTTSAGVAAPATRAGNRCHRNAPTVRNSSAHQVMRNQFGKFILLLCGQLDLACQARSDIQLGLQGPGSLGSLHSSAGVPGCRVPRPYPCRSRHKWLPDARLTSRLTARRILLSACQPGATSGLTTRRALARLAFYTR